MVVKKHIENTLNKLEKEYMNALSSPDPHDATYYAKLAILEYCGWIEETMDSIIRRIVKGKIKTLTFRQILDDSIIGNCHGFQYRKHFRKMLIQTVGLSKTEKLQSYLEKSSQLETFESELEVVKKDRDDAAHTWVSGTTKTYPAPSLTKGRLEKLYPILKNISNELKKY